MFGCHGQPWRPYGRPWSLIQYKWVLCLWKWVFNPLAFLVGVVFCLWKWVHVQPSVFGNEWSMEVIMIKCINVQGWKQFPYLQQEWLNNARQCRKSRLLSLQWLNDALLLTYTIHGTLKQHMPRRVVKRCKTPQTMLSLHAWHPEATHASKSG